MNRYEALLGLREKRFFTVADVALVFKIKPASAWTLCSRYLKQGIFVRLKKNVYVLEQSWKSWGRDDFLKIANFLQVPSYISFMTALSYYGLTTQLQQDFFESASLRRSREFRVKAAAFNFYKLKKELYFDFVKKGDIFIATKEKAFLDCVYLYSFGKYRIDFDSLSPDRLDRARIKKVMKIFPQKTRMIVRKLCKI